MSASAQQQLKLLALTDVFFSLRSGSLRDQRRLGDLLSRYCSHGGRGQIEAVRIAVVYLRFGAWPGNVCVGDFAVPVARLFAGAATTDKGRPDAHRFYERLGVKASHEGYKLAL